MTVFHKWTEELSQRILPLLPFDLEVVDPLRSGRGYFLYFNDPRGDLLAWEVEEGRISALKWWEKIRPFPGQIDREQFRQRNRAYLTLDPLTIDVGIPEGCPDWDWQDHFQEELRARADNAEMRPRFGSYPCYEQIRDYADLDENFIGEFPTFFYGQLVRVA